MAAFRHLLIGMGLAGALLAGCGLPYSTPLTKVGVQTIKSKQFDPPAGYYDKANSLQGRQLLSVLHRIIVPHTDLGYGNGRNIMFGKVDDLDNDDIVLSVYTGRPGERISDSQTASQRSMNTEHTWPQSKGAVGAAKSDLHHLFPSDMDANGRRSSFPFGLVKSVTWEGPDDAGINQHARLGIDAAGETVFEPRDLEKGNVARALLYFYTCYAVDSGAKVNLENFRVELPVLLKWHEQDAPDQNEKARNEAIFKAQTNRNPYIDHPEYVSQIGASFNP